MAPAIKHARAFLKGRHRFTKTPELISARFAIEIPSRAPKLTGNAAVRRDGACSINPSYSSPDCTPTTGRRGKDMVFLEHIGFGGRDRQLWMYYWDMRDGADFCGVSCHLF